MRFQGFGVLILIIKGLRFWLADFVTTLGQYYYHAIMENQMEKKMENEMETGVIG